MVAEGLVVVEWYVEWLGGEAWAGGVEEPAWSEEREATVEEREGASRGPGWVVLVGGSSWPIGNDLLLRGCC